jgi:hypothetical protein
VTERRLGFELRRQQVGIMHQHISAGRQVQGGRVVLAQAVRPGPERGRAVIGDVGEDAVPVAHPVAQGPAAFVRDLPHVDGEPVGDELPGLDGAECPVAAQVAGPDREVRR